MSGNFSSSSQSKPNYGLTHHKLQQKLFLRIHDQKGVQNNILRIEENLDGRTSFFSAKSNMATKNPNVAISLFIIAISQLFNPEIVTIAWLFD